MKGLSRLAHRRAGQGDLAPAARLGHYPRRSPSDTERLYRKGECASRWQAIRAVALRKLDMIDAAIRVEDLRAPPGNRLEKLKGNRKGLWSIRINDQWRVVFRWDDNAPEEVEIVNYH